MWRLFLLSATLRPFIAMFIVDDSALNFEIPARDSLGREAVLGKLSGTQDEVLLTWRLKDRTFRKVEGDMKTVRIPYVQVESVTFKATLGFINPRLVFLIADPHLIADVPGTASDHANLPGPMIPHPTI